MKFLILVAALSLTACKDEEIVMPDPALLTPEALSYCCQMVVAGHKGPKGQIHLEGTPKPLFFTQVRDVVAYLKSPERDAKITAVYVSDMGVAPSWARPGDDNWIDAKGAVFVVGAMVAGGMGAPEIVPFGDAQSAKAFIATYGGQTMTLDQIPDETVLGPVDMDLTLETPT
jgi:copper chaperone NosL